jgi:tetrathionate reductase subunit B
MTRRVAGAALRGPVPHRCAALRRRGGFQGFHQRGRGTQPDAKTKSRVYYKGLPKKFVAGTVYDPNEKEVIIGAKCTFKDDASNETFTVETDNFGDFWFNGLKDDRTFTLTITKGKKSKTVEGVQTSKDLSLGDIPMAL